MGAGIQGIARGFIIVREKTVGIIASRKFPELIQGKEEQFRFQARMFRIAHESAGPIQNVGMECFRRSRQILHEHQYGVPLKVTEKTGGFFLKEQRHVIFNA